MIAYNRKAFLVGLAVGLLVVWNSAGLAQPPTENPNPAPAAAADDDEPAVENGVEVLARGPIHEAFAEPSTATPRKGPVVSKKPPDPIAEVPPDQKPDNEDVIWIPGYWFWDDERDNFIWVSGFWRMPPPDRKWLPGHWTEVTDGWQWVSGMWIAEDQEDLTYLPTPPESLENGASTPAPDDNSFYVPGNWMYQDNDWAWRPGFWQTQHDNWVYTPASYINTPAGCVFRDGYWDYPLENRGMLFAPCAFQQPLWNQAGWQFQPQYVVPWNYLLNCLFVRPNWGHYCFGNYFNDQYRLQGFHPWYRYGLGQHGANPLWNYYRWHNRANPGWGNNLQNLYQARYRGTVPRPPLNLVQQRQLVQNIRNNRVNIGNQNTNTVINHVTGLTPLRRAGQQLGVRMRPISQPVQQNLFQQAQRLQAAAVQRNKAEANVVIKGPLTNQAQRSPQVVKVQVPRLHQAGRAHAPTPPLPHPRLPQRQAVPQAKPQPQRQAVPQAKPQPQRQVVPQPQPQPQRQVVPQAKPRPQMKPAPQAAPQAKPRPQAAPRLAPPAQPQRQVVPQPRPQAQPRMAPVPRPAQGLRPQAMPRPPQFRSGPVMRPSAAPRSVPHFGPRSNPPPHAATRQQPFRR